MNGEQNGRLALYLVMTFGITWVCWWPLASLIPAGAGVFTNPTFSTLYIAGGLGPTLAALLSVALTPREGSLRGLRGEPDALARAARLVSGGLPACRRSWPSRSIFWRHGSARRRLPFRPFATYRACR